MELMMTTLYILF